MNLEWSPELMNGQFPSVGSAGRHEAGHGVGFEQRHQIDLMAHWEEDQNRQIVVGYDPPEQTVDNRCRKRIPIENLSLGFRPFAPLAF